jgi:hypothetical protein
MLGKSSAPLGGHRPVDFKALGDLGVLEPAGGQQHNPGPLRERLRTRPAPCPRLQLRALLIRQLDGNGNVGWHDHLIPAATDLTPHDTSRSRSPPTR